MKIRNPNELKYNKRLEIMKNSFNNLKIILNPNLNNIQKKFFNKIIEIITSQIKIYMNLLISNNSKNIYEILNINNQNLSKEISFLYDKFCKNINNNDEQRKKEDHNIYNNKTIKPNNINNKEELIYNTVNYEINTDNDIIDKNLLEIELMEEPKPQIYSLLKLDSNNLIIMLK